MNYKEVKDKLKKDFVTLLKPKGYKKTKSELQGCGFYYTDVSVQYSIGYGVSNFEPVFDTGIYIGVAIISIQKIANFILEDGASFETYGSTIGSSTSNYFKELNYRFKITTEDDIKEWGEIVKKFYEEYAVPFFVKYKTVDAIDKLLNENPTEKVIYLDDLGWRIIKGLIAAKLNKNPKYNELREYYKSEVERKFQGYFMYEKCLRTIEFLDNHSQEELLKIAEG